MKSVLQKQFTVRHLSYRPGTGFNHYLIFSSRSIENNDPKGPEKYNKTEMKVLLKAATIYVMAAVVICTTIHEFL
jgi:hypothetical protein